MSECTKRTISESTNIYNPDDHILVITRDKGVDLYPLPSTSPCCMAQCQHSISKHHHLNILQTTTTFSRPCLKTLHNMHLDQTCRSTPLLGMAWTSDKCPCRQQPLLHRNSQAQDSFPLILRSLQCCSLQCRLQASTIPNSACHSSRLRRWSIHLT